MRSFAFPSSHPTAPCPSPGCAPGGGHFPGDIHGGAGGGQRHSRVVLQANTASPSWFALPNPECLSPRRIKPRWAAQAVPTNPTARGAPGLLPGCRAHKVLVDLTKCWLQARLLPDPKAAELTASPRYGPASALTRTPVPRTTKHSGIPVGKLRTPKAERKRSSRVLLESAAVGSSSPGLAGQSCRGSHQARFMACLIFHRGKAMGRVSQSSIATPLGLSTSFQETHMNPPNLDAKGDPSSPAHILSCFALEDFKVHRDRPLPSSDLFSTTWLHVLH